MSLVYCSFFVKKQAKIKDLLKVEDFNGEKKEYKVILNDYVLIGSEINAGSIFSVVNMDFYDTN